MKNILIGFLMATCMFLMIGATEEEALEMFVDGQVSVECEAPKYQGFGDGGSLLRYMIETETGKLYHMPIKLIGDGKDRVWKEMTAETDWIKE